MLPFVLGMIVGAAGVVAMVRQRERHVSDRQRACAPR
jgi:hypothetical protein